MLDELISLKKQHNFSAEINERIEYFNKKRGKSGISFHDDDIEKLYNEVKPL